MSLGARLVMSAGIFMLLIAGALQMWGESGRYTVHPQTLVPAVRGVTLTGCAVIAASIALTLI